MPDRRQRVGGVGGQKGLALAEAGDQREVPERVTGREGEREGAVAKQVDGALERAVLGGGGAGDVDRPVGGPPIQLSGDVAVHERIAPSRCPPLGA